MYNILVCDDEKDIVNALTIYLTAEGYKVFAAASGREALDLVGREELHLVLLDIMMPEMDGITAMTKIREISNLPVILLTAKSEDNDKIMGLSIGADDYITKPFNPIEVLARVKSQLRRYLQLGSAIPKPALLRIGGIELDNDAKTVQVDGDAVNLTPREFDILHLLISEPGKVFAPKEIYQRVWNELPYNADNIIAVHIRHIREKIEINPAEPRYLKVVWGRGYKMDGERC